MRTKARPPPAAKINDDAVSSDEEPVVVEPPKYARKRALQVATATKTHEQHEESLNDEGEDQQMEPDAEEDDEAVEERDEGGGDLAAEAVSFTSHKPPALAKVDDRQEHARPAPHSSQTVPRQAHARAISVSSTSSGVDDVHGPPTTDDDFGIMQAPFDQPSDDEQNASLPQPKLSRKQAKLVSKMPTVTASNKGKGNLKEVKLESEDDDTVPWLPHTDISSALSPASNSSWKVSITSMQPAMADVMREAVRIGSLLLLIGEYTLECPKYTAFEARGLEQFAYDALMEAAFKLNHDGKYDVAHRLLAGSQALYIKPLCAYVAGRLRNLRKAIKDTAAQILETALRVPNERADRNAPLEDQWRDRTPAELRELSQDVNFLYPRNADGVYDRSRPFAGAGIKEIVKAAFFVSKQYHDIGISNLGMLRSISDSHPDAPEVPPTMIAFTTTALESALLDLINHSDSEFTGNACHDSFKDHYNIALNYTKAHPGEYHELMHGMLVYASGGRVRQASQAANSGSRAKVDWDAIRARKAACT
ncbi:hypothetical protein C8T65DRAFT_652539 [Cerioporus squamosus]|nr:hypothetical protein C8T65DRAFT_652539 [Cerioporus squamosus]